MGFGPGMPGEFGPGGPGIMPGDFGPGGPGMMPGEMGPPARGSSRRGRRRKKSKRSRHTAISTTAERTNDAFVATISGTTPHKNAPAFLSRTLMKNLEQRNADYAKAHKLNFWIDRVKLVSCPPLVPPAQRDQFFKDGQYEGPVDPLTGEPLINDTCFTITCVIRLGNPASKDNKQADSTSAAENDIFKKLKSKKRRSRRSRRR